MTDHDFTTSDLIAFQFHETSLSAITDANGDPWFVAVDVCAVLGIKNVSDALSRLDADEKNTIVLGEGIRGNPERLIISESGLYELVSGSRKKIAQDFKRWVRKEVLPQIRKTGKYENAPRMLTTSEMFLAQAHINVEMEQRQAAIEARQDEQAHQIAALTKRQPPLGKSTIASWLKRNHKPYLPKSVLTNLRAACRRIETAEDFRPDGYDYPLPYYMPDTIATAYEQVTRQLSFFARDVARGHGQ